jgi:hypothetical protein
MDRYFVTYTVGGLLAPHHETPWVVVARDRLHPDANGGYGCTPIARYATKTEADDAAALHNLSAARSAAAVDELLGRAL